MTAAILLTEKKEGIIERMMVSGIKTGEVFASTVVIQMTIHTIQTAISMYVMYIWFDNPYLGDHFLTISLLLLIGMEGMIFGFLIAAIFNDFMFAAYIGAGSNLIMSFTCGLIWPLEGAHYLLQITGPLFPLTAPVRALLAITARGWSYDAEPVYTGFLSIFCWSGVLIIALYVTSRRNKNLWVITK